MKKLAILLAAIAPLGLCGQTYDYRVEYHAGIVDATAGYGHVTLSDCDGTLTATLGGHSIDWAGRIYTVADTLVATFDAEPVQERVEYINGVYTKPRVGTVAAPEQFRDIHGQGQLGCSSETMEAVAVTAQMLGLYRLLPLLSGQMCCGQTRCIPIATPQGPESVTLTYLGPDGEGMERYSFMYTYQGREVPYAVTCIVDPASGIPQSFSANLRIGHLAMERI